MNTAEFALPQLQEHKLCFSGKTNVDVVFSLFGLCLFGLLFAMYD